MFVNDIYASSISADQQQKKYKYFSSCDSSLYSIQINTIPSYAFAFQDISYLILSNCEAVNKKAFYGCSQLKSIYFSNCSIINEGAFELCSALSYVTLPKCKIIEKYAFKNCDALSNINLPACLTIKENAFEDCSSLNVVQFSNCSTIGKNAFSNCVNLRYINANNCMTINDCAFYNCSSLNQVLIPNCMTIGNSAFMNCSNLTTINLSLCSIIGIGAFQNDYNLMIATLNNCEIIESSAFQNCSRLSTISLPKCSCINESAFYSCNSLRSMYLLSNAMTTLSSINVFINSPVSNSSYLNNVYGSIYVPSSLYSSYIADPMWIYYSSRIVPFGAGVIGPYIVYYIVSTGSDITWTGYDQSVYYSSTFVVQSTEPAKTDYDFKGWNTNSTATTGLYQAGQTVSIGGNMTLYPIFNYNKIFTLKFVGGSRSGQSITYNVTDGMTWSSFISSSQNSGGNIYQYLQYITYGGLTNGYAGYAGYVIYKDSGGGSKVTTSDTISKGNIYYAIYADDYVGEETEEW